MWNWYDFDFYYKDPSEYNEHDNYVINKINEIKLIDYNTKKSKKRTNQIK